VELKGCVLFTHDVYLLSGCSSYGGESVAQEEEEEEEEEEEAFFIILIL